MKRPEPFNRHLRGPVNRILFPNVERKRISLPAPRSHPNGRGFDGDTVGINHEDAATDRG